MTRRAWWLGLAVVPGVALARKPELIPPVTDRVQWNAFAATCNSYTGLLEQGILDVKAWARVRSAWERMTR